MKKRGKILFAIYLLFFGFTVNADESNYMKIFIEESEFEVTLLTEDMSETRKVEVRKINEGNRQMSAGKAFKAIQEQCRWTLGAKPVDILSIEFARVSPTKMKSKVKAVCMPIPEYFMDLNGY